MVPIVADQPALEAEFRPYQSYLRNRVPRWDITKLGEAFHSALQKNSKSLTILIDGLDDYSGDVIQLLRLLHNIAESRESGVRHKVCLASRPEKELALGFVDCPRFRMQDHNSSGIEKYVSNTMQLFKSDEQEQLSRSLAYKAEGVFLWARFAVMEIVQYKSSGEEFEELLCRLDRFPPDMNNVYDRILGRMSTDDQLEARLVFQLVSSANPECEGRKSLTILQLKEAVSVAKTGTAVLPHGSSRDDLNKFRKRIRGKCGGMLDEDLMVDPYFLFKQSKDDIDDDLKRILVRLIHRTANSYLEGKGWLKEWRNFRPHILWLHVCSLQIQRLLGPRLRSQYTKKGLPDAPWDFLASSVRYSLVQYACDNLFYHARSMEYLYNESSFTHLSLVDPSIWSYLREKCRPSLCYIPMVPEPGIDWKAIDKGPNIQPWRIVAQQGLTLCCHDVLLRELYKPQGDDNIISIAIFVNSKIRKASFGASGTSLSDLVKILLAAGPVVSRMSVALCLHYGTAAILKVLLESQPTKGENYVDILWGLTMSPQDDRQFKAMLEVILDRKDGAIFTSGLGGNVLHSLIVSFTTMDVFLMPTRLATRAEALIECDADFQVRYFQFTVLPANEPRKRFGLGHPLGA